MCRPLSNSRSQENPRDARRNEINKLIGLKDAQAGSVSMYARFSVEAKGLFGKWGVGTLVFMACLLIYLYVVYCMQ